MTEHTVSHDTFVIERTYDASPARVFAAWADPAAKTQWFAGPDAWASGSYSLDFRVGGREHNGGGPEGGPIYSYDAVYQDIVQDRRIVTTYDMHMDGALISVSVATIEFEAAGSGTRLTLTEQGVFLDGLDTAAIREHGTRELLDGLGAALERQAVAR